MNKTTWVLVANSSIARLFHLETLQKLNEINQFEHPESRLKNMDLVSDKPGRDFESFNNTRHAMEQKTMPKKLEAFQFAKHLAEYLEQASERGKYDELMLIAGPTFLGVLRETISPNLAKLIKKEIDKDLTQLTPKEILSHLS